MNQRHHPMRILALFALGALALGTVDAAQTDLSSLPLITSAPQDVKPNLMFILDDSGSMAWSFMPDTAQDFAAVLTNCDRSGNCTAGTNKYGYRSSQCNGVYYNPNIVYSPPVQVSNTGAITTYANQSFTAAKRNGYDGSSASDDLSNAFQPWRTSDTNLNFGDAAAGAAHYYVYSGSQTTEALRNYLDTSSTFYRECASNIGDTASVGYPVFTRVDVSSTSGPGGTDERTNFANWYSYYRTRMLMMKTSTGRAFQNIGDRYRVGYMSINNNVSPSFLNISDFNGSQKNAWYTKLYGASPSNSTPLREALSNAGRIFAHQVTSLYGTDVIDPMQFSCQKNFALLSTDGYWNGSNGVQLDGTTAIGNQDIGGPRPYNDGGTAANVYTATITVTSTANTDNVTSIRVNGAEILSSTATTGSGFTGRSGRLASAIVTRINNCTASTSGNCTVAGYSASRSTNVITITAPAAAGALSVSPVVTINGATATIAAFSGSAVQSGGVADTLADVAYYYYQTDLRTTALGNQNGVNGTSVEENIVLPGGDDDATWQHMTTFTLGLGARGRMIYSPTYKSDTTGDYAAVKNGSTASSSVCSWQTAGTACTWPVPGANLPENIDDLWHAAVNGRGSYFSARDPSSLSVGLTSALQGITAMTSDAAAATTSNPNVTAGDNFIFSSTFRSSQWFGELERRQIDTTTGTPAASADWNAGTLLDGNTARTIYTFDASTSSKLKTFDWASLTSSERDYFGQAYVSTTASPPLSQFCGSGEICLSSSAQSDAAGEKLVNFIRGDRSYEGTAADLTKYFRLREHVLGDIVNSEAVYVRLPMFDYADTGYSTFKTSAAIVGRTAMVYVGANDGMLHAFNASTGAEAWAYVPRLLMPALYRLADKFYPTNHQYYVDGSPQVADVKFSDGTWHTILVGGFNAGGRGYYALDVTDPTNPKALWEFTDANMGLSFGRPEVVKLANGTWVVLVTSGYNNVSPGDGAGRLYVVNAQSGAKIREISTGVGSASSAITGVCADAPCPSGLAQIRAWVENTRYDNTAVKVYGGDLYGNLWRFDINDTIAPSGYEATLLAALRGPTGAVQSITARPELGKVAGYPVVYVGTGRYLGAADLTNSEVQSIYAIKDDGSTTSAGNPRSNVSATGFVRQTLTDGTCPSGRSYCAAGTAIRTGTSNVVNFATQKGWFVDLPGTRERATTDPQLALGTLTFTTNLLNPSACSVGGTSYINYFDYRTGAPISTAGGMVSMSLGGALATRSVQLKFSDGTVRSLVRMSDNSWQTPTTPIPPTPGGTRRISWRELVAP